MDMDNNKEFTGMIDCFFSEIYLLYDKRNK